MVIMIPKMAGPKIIAKSRGLGTLRRRKRRKQKDWQQVIMKPKIAGPKKERIMTRMTYTSGNNGNNDAKNGRTKDHCEVAGPWDSQRHIRPEHFLICAHNHAFDVVWVVERCEVLCVCVCLWNSLAVYTNVKLCFFIYFVYLFCFYLF
jgi:hypothetical protein